MKRHVLFSVVGLVVAGAVGCTAPTSAEEGEEGSEDALTSRQLPGVAAVEIAEVRAPSTILSSKTLGAPKKVKSIVTSVKKLRPTDPVPRCLPRDATRLTFLDAAGRKVATISTYCAGYGGISFENGREGYSVRISGEAIEAAKSAPFAVGDALWGITKIQLSQPRDSQKRTLTGEKMKPILGGFDLDAVPDAHASMPRCLPTHSVTFERSEKNVAFTSFICGSTDGATAPASIKAQFTAVDPAAGPDTAPLASGAIQVDPRPVLAAFDTRR